MKMPRRSASLALFLLTAALAACDDRGSPLPTTAPTAARAEPAPLLTVAEAIPGRYVVVLNPETAGASATAAAEEAVAAGAQVHYTYESALKGFAATLSPQAVEQLRRDPRVSYVIPDGWAYPSDVPWGLDRIDQRSRPLNGTYVSPATGAGVRVYVIDSGIRTSHEEFDGRASVGVDLVGDGQNGQDCRGHGTHVAGTVAGTTYGVAKDAEVVSVRVFGCTGPAEFSTIIAAVNWVTANAELPAVANMSLGGSVYAPLNTAVQNSIAAGVVYTVSAGNEIQNACNTSPASAPNALTVGASTTTDFRASFSNWGPCLDLFAPGEGITSAWYTSNTATNVLNGTSMAAPHVAGVAALFLQDRPIATPAQVREAIIPSSSYGKLSNIRTGSPNRLLFSWLPPATAVNVAGTPTGPTQVRVTWTDVASTEIEYQVRRSIRNPDGSWTYYGSLDAVTANVTLLNDNSAVPGTFYRYAVRGCNLAGCSAWAYSRPVLALGLPPTPVLSMAAVSGTAVRATWTDASATETSFVLERGLLGTDGVTWGAYAVVVTLPANQRTYRNEGLLSGRQYRYRIKACNAAGCGAYSAAQSVTPPTVPALPTSFTATAFTSTQVRLNWTDASNNETHFVIWRAVPGLFGTWRSYVQIATPLANSTFYTDLTATPGQRYLYRITACNVAGCGPLTVRTFVATPN
jgi:subtilisin family serine protease